MINIREQRNDMEETIGTETNERVNKLLSELADLINDGNKYGRIISLSLSLIKYAIGNRKTINMYIESKKTSKYILDELMYKDILEVINKRRDKDLIMYLESLKVSNKQLNLKCNSSITLNDEVASILNVGGIDLLYTVVILILKSK